MLIHLLLIMTVVASATASPVELPVPEGTLGATWQQTNVAPKAVVVILPGSGPTDRNGNGPMIQTDAYKLLAEGLADKGVASLRVDKRGMFTSQSAASNPNAVTLDILAADALLWAQDASRRAGTDCAWLIGHSEGGLVALIAAQTGEGLCGVILVAAPGRPLGEVMREQLRANPANAPLLADFLAGIDALEAGQDFDTTGKHPAVVQFFNPTIQPFLKVMFSYDPAALVASAKVPVVIIQGDTDIQVSQADAEALKAARPDAPMIILKGINHVLKAAPLDRAANLVTYTNPALPLGDGVVEAIAAAIAP